MILGSKYYRVGVSNPTAVRCPWDGNYQNWADTLVRTESGTFDYGWFIPVEVVGGQDLRFDLPQANILSWVDKVYRNGIEFSYSDEIIASIKPGSLQACFICYGLTATGTPVCCYIDFGYPDFDYVWVYGKANSEKVQITLKRAYYFQLDSNLSAWIPAYYENGSQGNPDFCFFKAVKMKWNPTATPATISFTLGAPQDNLWPSQITEMSDISLSDALPLNAVQKLYPKLVELLAEVQKAIEEANDVITRIENVMSNLQDRFVSR